MGRLFGEVEGVVAEAIDVLGQIRADCGDGILGNGLAALFEGLDEPGERAEIVKDQASCDQVVVFDGLPQFVAAVFHDDPFASEEGPLEEAIEGLALVGGTLDCRAQVGVRDVAQQKPCANDSSKFAERLVEPVLRL